uniref:Uncharacterized protein n=1 Tax=Amphora coffeiformis TaxID=265554 RepID=A0A7S3L5U2_9STRA
MVCLVRLLIPSHSSALWLLWKTSKNWHSWRAFRKYHGLVSSWASIGHPNAQHLVPLLDASLVIHKGTTISGERREEVKRGFERSISTVFCGGFLHHATLANELAGKFISDSNEKCYYLSQAKHHYPTWGAKAVTRKLNLLLREVANDNSKNGVIDLGPERARETAPNKGKSAVSEGKDAAADPLSAGV